MSFFVTFSWKILALPCTQDPLRRKLDGLCGVLLEFLSMYSSSENGMHQFQLLNYSSPVPEDPGIPGVWLSEGKMSLVAIALYLKTQVPGVWLREGNELAWT
jgi:hypothetical protein